MPSRRLTPGGNRPPSCRYLWTASRPVNTTPDIRTSSRTFSARIFSSVKGKERSIIFSLGKFPGDGQWPPDKFRLVLDRNDKLPDNPQPVICICPKPSCDNEETRPVAAHVVNLPLNEILNSRPQSEEVLIKLA